MTYRFLILLLTGLFFMTSPSPASDRILDIRQHRSPNGIDFWHVYDDTLPIITINYAFRGAGAITDNDTKQGRAQIASNTLDEGAGTRDSSAFQQTLDDHAIELTFRSNRDHMTGRLKTLVRHKDLAFGLLHDAINTPRFDKEAIDRMKNANIMRIKSAQSNPEWLAARLMNDTYFGNHPYARNSGGTISGIKSITAKDLKNYHKTYFTSDRLVIAIAGHIDPNDAGNTIDKIFSSLPKSPAPLDDVEPHQVTPPESPVTKSYKTESPQSVISMTWPSIQRNDPDYFALRVMNHLLGAGGFSSFLMDEVRDKRGLTYGIYSRMVHMDQANILSIESAASPENIAPMQSAITDVLNHLKTSLVDPQKLAEAKSYLIGSLPLKFATTQSLSRTALNMQLDHLSIESLDEWISHIENVTAQDVQAMAQRIFAETMPKATVITGAIPEGLNTEAVTKIRGIE